MQATEIQAHAQRLYAAFGPKAVAEAAQKARAAETSRDDDQARTWRRVEAALREMHGPRMS